MQFVLKNVSTNSAKTGTLSTDSPVVTSLSNVTDLYVGQFVENADIPFNTTILSIDSATQITLSKNATGFGATTITFFTPVNCLGDEPVISVWGVFNGGTVTFETSPDSGGTWLNLIKRIDGLAAAFTNDANAVCYRVSQGHWIRALLSGSAGAIGIYATIGM